MRGGSVVTVGTKRSFLRSRGLYDDLPRARNKETDQSEFAQLEEAFAVIHKATLHVIKEERDRDAAPRAGKPRLPESATESAARR